MGGFHDRRQFVGWNQGHVPRAFAADDYYFLLRRDAIEHRRKLVAKLCVGGLHLLIYCTGFLYAYNALRSEHKAGRAKFVSLIREATG